MKILYINIVSDEILKQKIEEAMKDIKNDDFEKVEKYASKCEIIKNNDDFFMYKCINTSEGTTETAAGGVYETHKTGYTIVITNYYVYTNNENIKISSNDVQNIDEIYIIFDNAKCMNDLRKLYVIKAFKFFIEESLNGNIKYHDNTCNEIRIDNKNHLIDILKNKTQQYTVRIIKNDPVERENIENIYVNIKDICDNNKDIIENLDKEDYFEKNDYEKAVEKLTLSIEKMINDIYSHQSLHIGFKILPDDRCMHTILHDINTKLGGVVLEQTTSTETKTRFFLKKKVVTTTITTKYNIINYNNLSPDIYLLGILYKKANAKNECKSSFGSKKTKLLSNKQKNKRNNKNKRKKSRKLKKT